MDAPTTTRARGYPIEIVGTAVMATALIAFVTTLASDEECSTDLNAVPWLLRVCLVLLLCGFAVLVARRGRFAADRIALIVVLIVFSSTLLWYFLQQHAYPKLVTSGFLEDYADNHPVNNASIFVPGYLADFDGVDAAELRCVIDEAEIPGPGVVAATVGDLRAALQRCGLANVTQTYCVVYPNT